MTATLYHYPGCDTCRKARKWLKTHAAELEVELVHLVEAPPDVETLRSLHARSGQPLRRFFNTSGGSYRSGGFKERLPAMSEQEQLEALAADGMLIKRPVLDLGEVVLVGFAELEWAAAVG